MDRQLKSRLAWPGVCNRLALVKPLWRLTVLLALQLAEPCHAKELILGKDQLWLVQLDQKNSDLIVGVRSRYEQFQVDHPSGHAGPELLFLGPYSETTHLNIGVSAKDSSQIPDYELHANKTAGISIKFAQQIQRAGQIYVETGLNINLTELYLNVLQEAELNPLLHDHILYLAAHSALLSRQANRAKEIVSSHHFLGACDRYCYKQSMLLGLIEFQTLNYHDAARYLQVALLQLEKKNLTVGMQKEKAELLSTYGFVSALLGKRDLAASMIQEAVRLLSNFDDQIVRARVLNMQANYQASTGNLIQSRKTLSIVAELFATQKDILSHADALINLSMLHKLLGDYQQGIVVAQKALGLFQASDAPESVLGSAYDRLASLYQIVGDYERANQLFELAYKYEKNHGNLSRAMRIKGHIASNMRDSGAPAEAEFLHRKSLDHFILTEEIGEVIIHRQELALDLIELGQLDEAMQEIDTALQLQDQAPGFIRLDELNLVRASVLRKQLRFDEARALLEDSLNQFVLADTALGTQISYGVMLMLVFKEMAELDRAIDIGRRVLAQIMSVRADLEIRRLGPAWSRQTQGAISVLADIYLQKYLASDDMAEAVKAFEILESAQGKALRRQIRSNRSQNKKAALPSDEQEYEQKLTILANKRASASPGTKELSELTIAYYQTLELLEMSREQHFSNQITEQAGLADIQRRLPSGYLALRFYCPESSRCWLFIFDQHHFTVKSIENAALETLISSINNSLRASETADNELLELSAIMNLSDGPFGFQGYDRLLVSADYPFNLVPFATLPLAEGQTWIDQYAIVSVPSLTGFITDPMLPFDHQGLDLVVLADPVFEGLASTENGISHADRDNLRAWSNTLQRLPWSAEEAKSLQELYGENNFAVYIGDQANRANLLDEKTRNARILHIASHAYFNQATPDLVGIAISSDKDHKGIGFITLNELLSYPINNNLVVISGCETGVGEYYPGEGDMSLAWGFHAQGAAKVVSTRWPVSDRASAIFMRYFHEALVKDGLDAEKALALAQKRMKKNPRYRTPFYWAGYVLSATRL